MRFAATWLLVACLGLSLSARSAELEGGRLDELPAGARKALEAFARHVETGDRDACLKLLLPESRASASPLLDELLASPTSPRAELRLRLAGWQEVADGIEARTLMQVRMVPRRERDSEGEGIRPQYGYPAWPLAMRWFSAGGSLVVEMGAPASVVAARVDWRLDADADRLLVRSELVLAPEVAGVELIALTVPPETDRVTVLAPEAEVEWLRVSDEGAGGALVLRLREPLSGPLTVSLEHEAAVPDKARAGGDTLYLAHGALIAPWAEGRFHTWDVTLDVPAELSGVSLGTATELEAPEGRRRLRYATTRLIDYPGLAVGRFRVDRRGPLELWRVARVGGSAEKLLGELAELVEFHETRVAPLPYGAFRLVEVDMGFARAVSYASVIFMKTGVMAQAKQRFSILSHEVAHQWWGNAVQGDQHTRWISEGMANALMDLFVAHVESEDEKQDLLDRHRESTLTTLGPGALPLASVRGRSSDFYERGALFVHALREAVGDETFWKILRAWYAEHAGPAAGTPALRATAERVAERDLAEVFEPWLGSTALPLIDMEWSADGPIAKLAIIQDEPFFSLEVPIEAMLTGGRSEWTRVSIGGARTETTWELPEAPLALRLDPKQVTPRVRDAEVDAYLIAEAGACLARGEHERGLALLERIEATGAALPEDAVKWRAAALALEGRVEDSDAGLAQEFASLAPDAELNALLSRVDDVLAGGDAALGLRLSDELAARVQKGAAVHLRRAHALRMLDREKEARLAWGRALEARPDNDAARLALGLPAADDPGEAPTVLDDEDERLAGNHPESVSLLVASRDRWGLMLPGSRSLLLGQGDELERVPDFSPSGLLAAVVVEAETERPIVMALEGGRRRGRLSVVELDARGRGRPIAKHERLPAKAQRLLSDGKRVFVAWKSRESGLDWYRFLPDSRGAGTAGPDDRDGLLTLKVKGDARFEFFAKTPEVERVVVLASGGLAWLDSDGVLRSSDSVLWEELEAGAWNPLDLRRAGDGAGLLLAGDRSLSPFAEDSLPERRLVVVDPERLVERRLPDDALQAVLAPDGSVLVLRGRAGCSSAELSVSRLPPAE